MCLMWLEGSGIAPKPYKFLETPIGDDSYCIIILRVKHGRKNVSAVADLLNRCSQT